MVCAAQRLFTQLLDLAYDLILRSSIANSSVFCYWLELTVKNAPIAGWRMQWFVIWTDAQPKLPTVQGIIIHEQPWDCIRHSIISLPALRKCGLWAQIITSIDEVEDCHQSYSCSAPDSITRDVIRAVLFSWFSEHYHCIAFGLRTGAPGTTVNFGKFWCSSILMTGINMPQVHMLNMQAELSRKSIQWLSLYERESRAVTTM